MKIIKSTFKNLDDKVNPNVGYTLFKIFKFMTLFLFFIGLPVVVLGFATAELNHYNFDADGVAISVDAINSAVIYSVSCVYIGLLLISSLLWAYFSKWNG